MTLLVGPQKGYYACKQNSELVMPNRFSGRHLGEGPNITLDDHEKLAAYTKAERDRERVWSI